MAPFALTGKVWDSSIATTYLNGSECLYWNSGDFSAATDGISRPIQEYTTKLICDKLHLYGQRLVATCLKASMDMHTIHYNDLGEVEQLWGQLMGSPFSFLILCIINFCTTWASCEAASGTNLTYNQFVRRHRPLINGDDNLFGFPDMSYYDCWVDYCREAGLNRSPGKNYVSSEFLMVNSRPMWIERDDLGKVRLLSELFTCNSGLIRGQGRVLVDKRNWRKDERIKSIDRELLSAADQLQMTLRCADQQQRKRIFERFQWNMRKKLRASRRSWCLDRFLGGFGLPFGKASEGQRRIAACILDSHGKQYPTLSIGCNPKPVVSSITLNNDGWDYVQKDRQYLELHQREHNIFVKPHIRTELELSSALKPCDRLGSLDEMSQLVWTEGLSNYDKVMKKVFKSAIEPIAESAKFMRIRQFCNGILKWCGREDLSQWVSGFWKPTPEPVMGINSNNWVEIQQGFCDLMSLVESNSW
jgi:hypothetical protein